MNTSTEQEFGSLLIVNLTKALQDTNLGNDCVCWIAEAAKDPDARNDANQIGALQKLLELLEIAMTRREEEFVKNSLRALANLCFDHDDNRDEILEIENGIHKIVSCLDLGFANLDLTTFGALLNISMENELVQTLMVKEGLIVKIFEHLKPLQTKIPESELGRETICMAIKVTSSILESDSGLLEFFNMDGPSLFSTIIKTLMLELNPSSPILDWIIQTMDAISLVLETLSIKEESQIKITNSSLFPTILEFVQVGFGDDNIDNLKLSFCKVICIVTMADGNMKSLVNDTNVISTFKAWTLKTNFSIKLDDEVRMTGALCLGNIARSDETCLSLVRLGVLDPLIGLIKREGIRLREVTEDKFLSKVVHGGLGTLKNLSLAPGTRVEMGSKDVIGVLVDLFNVELIKPFHVTIISTIKNLCMGANDGNVYRVLTGLEPGKSDLKGLPIPSALTKSPLAKIVKVIWNSSKELDSGVKSEGGRLIVNIVKAIHKSNAKEFLSVLMGLNCVTLLVQILTGAHLTKRSDEEVDGHSDHHVQFDALGESTRVFPIVQDESVVALTLLCSMHPPTIESLVKFGAIPVTLLKILKSPGPSDSLKEEETTVSHTIHAKMNVLLLIKTLVTKAGFEDESRSSLVKVLTDLVNSDDATRDASTVEFQFQAAISDILKSVA